MWISVSLISALLLGVYDVAKKASLKKNSVMWTLFGISVISTLLLTPFFRGGTAEHFLLLVPKAFLVTFSWVSGLEAMKLLPMTTASTMKASRPVFVVIASVLLFGEKLSAGQWAGVVTVTAALFMLSRTSRNEGIRFSKSKGVVWMLLSIITGAASALYDKQVVSCVHMHPMFVQCWSNLMITVLMGIVLAYKCIRARRTGSDEERFHWDWHMLAAALLIVAADACYFHALSEEGAILAVISLLRRSCVVVTFTLSAWLFKEGNVRNKAIDLAVLLSGVVMLSLFS